MKKLFLILSVFICAIASYSQDVIGSRVIAKQSFYLRDWYVDSIKRDTNYLINNDNALMTAGAIYQFVNNRIGGGGGGGTWGSITGTLSNQTDLQNALNLKAPLISPSFTTPDLGVASATSLTTSGGSISNLGTSSASRFIVSADNNIAKIFSWRTANSPRWAARVDGNETGANAGGDWALRRYDDAGTYIGDAISFVRSTGAATFSGTVTFPTPFTLGATSVTTTGTQFNYLNAATGTTGTASTNIVFSTSPLFTTPRLASTSTTGYVWTATDASGNGSFQEIPSDNLIVQNAGSGTQTWFTSGDTLYMKMVKNTTFISASTDTDSSLLISLSATGTPSSSTYLRGDNTWATIAGGGDVTKVGTPVNNQVGVWTGDGTLEGDANLTFASSTLNIGVAGASTGIFTLSGVTSGTVTIQPASAAGTYTLTLPTNDGDASQFLQTNGSGVLTWATASGSGDVTKVGTPVNNQLGIWTGDGTIEGDANLTFASSTLNIGVAGSATGILTQSGVTSGTITFQPASAAGTYTLTWPTNDGDANQVLTTNGSGVLSWETPSGGSSSFGIIQAATYTLTSTTSTQKLFDAVTNGEITLTANTTYLFDCIFSLTAMSATSGNCTFDIIGAGTATFTSVAWIGNTRDANIGGATAASNIFSQTSASSGQIAQASTSTEFYAHIKGIIRVNAGGTIIPSIGLVTAAAAVVGTNSYFKLTPIGDGSVVSW